MRRRPSGRTRSRGRASTRAITDRDPSTTLFSMMVLVTGASGQIGSRLCSLLRTAGQEVLAVDIHPDAHAGIQLCDIREGDKVKRLFESAPIRTVVHLAAVLPSAFRADPVAAAQVNLTGALNVLGEAVAHRV